MHGDLLNLTAIDTHLPARLR